MFVDCLIDGQLDDLLNESPSEDPRNHEGRAIDYLAILALYPTRSRNSEPWAWSVLMGVPDLQSLQLLAGQWGMGYSRR